MNNQSNGVVIHAQPLNCEGEVLDIPVPFQRNKRRHCN